MAEGRGSAKMKRKLKPYPLCGSTHVERGFEEYISDGIVGVAFKIRCQECGVELNEVGMACTDRATKKWNRRAGEEG